MLNVSIEKTLKEHKKNDLKPINSDPVKEVKLLLQGDASEELRILQALSPTSEFARIQNMAGKQIEIEKLEDKYLGNVFNLEQIKRLAIDYHLRFLEARYYTGSFDSKVAIAIKNFAKETNSPMDNYSLGRNYVILAPAECFHLREEKHVFKSQLDPAIFYRIDNDHYKLIHKWGKDFTILRLIEGYKWKNWSSYHWFHVAVIIPIVVLLSTLLFGPMVLAEHSIMSLALIFGASHALAFVIKSAWKLDDMTPVEGFFSPGNWNSDTKLIR